MLHELIDFFFLGCVLLSDSLHELLHLGDISVGNRLSFVSARLLTSDIHDAVAISGGWCNLYFVIEK